MIPSLPDLGRWLIVGGLALAGAGLLFVLLGRIPWLGRLPGDFRFQVGGVSCLFPLVTSLVLSLVLTIVLNLVVRLLGR